jgi:hypothetical protein
MVEKKRFEIEELKEVLTVVSDKVPSLIKGLVGSVFSEDTARNMAKAAATYYTELKTGGLPDEAALKMTQDYVATFSKIGEILSQAGKQQIKVETQHSE